MTRDEITLYINSNNRIDINKSSNDAQYYFDWSSILGEGRYKMDWTLTSLPNTTGLIYPLATIPIVPILPDIVVLTSDQLASLASSTQAQIAALTQAQIVALITTGLFINTLVPGAPSPNCQRYDSFGNLYIGGVGIIQTYINNVLTTVAGNGNAGFSGDGGLATAASIGYIRGINFDSVGNIYFADYTNNVIRKINISNGFITTIAGTGGSAGNSGSGVVATSALLNGPHDLVFDSTGNMYISCRGSSVINKIATNGIITTIAGTGTSGYSGDGASATLAAISTPCQLFLNKTTMCLYFADGGSNRIRKIDLNSGIITTVAGSGSGTSSGDGGAATLAGFDTIRGLTFDSVGNMYISECYKVRKVDASGIITTYAGTGGAGNTGSGGVPTLATFGQAFYLCFDPSGNLVICDYNNYIKKISSSYYNPLSTTQIPYLTTTQIPFLITTYLIITQMQALTPTQILALTPTQISGLTLTQISGLTNTQLSVLNPTLLSPTQISVLSAIQYSIINNGVINSTTYTSPFQPYLVSSSFSLNAGTYYMLVVGGGGGGGVDRSPTAGGSVTGGGGGAGGVLQKTVVLTAMNIITIVIGYGGDRSTQTSPASNGGNTTVSFSVDTGNNIIATGGGYGGGISGYSTGGNGGSGGGGGGTFPNTSGTGISGQGFNGGPSGEDRYSGAGGGGAGGNTSNSIGGIGVKCTLTTISSNYPSTYYWGGGGGGGGGGTSQAGGYGGGGNGGGGVNTLNPSSSALNVGGSGYLANDPAGYGGGGNGGTNTGGGGGGAGRATIATTLGGYGGSGIVVIGQ